MYILAEVRDFLLYSNSHYETNFGVANTKIGFLKAGFRQAFKQQIY